MPDNIFFDWDGTLTDSLPMLFKSHNHARESLGYPAWSLEEYKGQMYRSSLDLYPDLYGEESDKALEYLFGYFEANHIENLSAMTGASALLDALKDMGVCMGLVSNKKHQYLEREVDHMSWNHYFKAVIGAGYAEEDKPSAVPLLKALSMAGVDQGLKEVWYVGDTRTDIETARNAGCISILLTNGENKDLIIDEYKPDYVFNNLDNLFAAIVESNEKKAC